MMTRLITIVTALLTCGGLFPAPPAAAAESPDRPNIIFLLTDDMRWDAMGCAGNAIIRTPNLDRLAAEGVMFTNAFCTTSICAVSRASILAGQYESRHRISDFTTPFSPEAYSRTFPDLLRKHGYRTGFIGKWGVGGPLPKGEFDFFDGFPGQGKYFVAGDSEHLTDKMSRAAVRFIRESAGGPPFLLCISTKAPHVQDEDPRQFIPDPKYDDLYRDVTIPTPKTAAPKYFDMLPAFNRESEGRARWNKRFATPEMYQTSVKNYYRLIAGIDDLLGTARKTLDELGATDRTVIVFTSDNGFFLGEHGLAGKWLMYEESIRLPLIVRDPALASPRRGTKVDEIALSIDLAPTILERAGVPVPESVQGRSLLPLLRGEKPAWRKDWFYEHRFRHKTIPQTEGVRTERWKYTRYIESDPLYEELFDLQADPYEEHNLATDPQHAASLDRMRERWGQLRREVK